MQSERGALVIGGGGVKLSACCGSRGLEDSQPLISPAQSSVGAWECEILSKAAGLLTSSR